MSSQLLWYTTRATGIVSMVLLTGTVVLGIVGTARAMSERWPRIVTAGLHRNLALTSVALVGVHILTTVLDPFAAIGLVSAFVPFSSDYRPFWLSLGTVAFDLLLAVIITSLLRDRLNHRTWQVVHLLVYACWPVALWHGLGTGTDTKLSWVLAIYVACVVTVGWAVWWRLALTEHPIGRRVAVLGLAVLPLATIAFVFFGPLQPGWARRAGTPAAQLGTTVSATSPGSTGQASALVDVSFTGRVRVTNGPGDDERTIRITGQTTSAPSDSFVLILQGTPSGGGVDLSGGTARIGQLGTSSGFRGPVVQLSGNEIVAAVTGQAGQRRAQFVLTINGSTATGTMSLLAATGQR